MAIEAPVRPQAPAAPRMIEVVQRGKVRPGAVGQRVGEFGAAGEDNVYVVTTEGGPKFVDANYRLTNEDLSVFVTADGVAGR